MKNTLGNELTVTVFGESHGPAIGCVIDGLPSGARIDQERLNYDMGLRRAAGKISTARKEADEVKFLSGVRDGIIEGTPLALIIENTNVRRKDYDEILHLARPGHADYAAEMRYKGYQDASGGGHFSGRLTAPLTAAGSIVRKLLEDKGILIASHIKELHGIKDDPLLEHNIRETMAMLNTKAFPVLSERVEIMMKSMIEDAAKKKDSVGGILETVVCGMEPGIGEPMFGALESDLSAALFAIPAVKGVEFGEGFGFSDLYGSEANDRFTMFHDSIATITNHNGGINGGISNGMTIRFNTCIKPTPSIAKPQFTVDFKKKENTEIRIRGRHDPAIIHRARIVVESVTALVLADALASAHGRQWLGEKE
ncbi:MAG: chorismate synthase [Solobacterium sp.]|nr:chorismate synthase [Solobacterium sp.]